VSIRRRDALVALTVVVLALATWLLFSGPVVDFRSSPVPSS